MVLPTSTGGGAPRSYHHGKLRQALIDAALELAQQSGPQRVSVREAARRLGVSPAAPFRHFPNRRALMTAVAEEGSERLRIEVKKCLAREKGGPLARLRSIGTGYLLWAQRNPAHFGIASARDQIDVDGSVSLRQNIQEVRALMVSTLQAAQAQGAVAAHLDAQVLALLARATSYGLARMQLDGHLAQWGVTTAQAPAAMQGVLDLLGVLMAGSVAERSRSAAACR